VAEPLSGSGRLPIRMLHDRVLVRTPGEDGERRSTGGILIPPTAQVAATRLVWAEVLAVGNHVRSVTACCSARTTRARSRCRASSI
jgi:chaperonin GroES